MLRNTKIHPPPVCPICGSVMAQAFTAKVLCKYRAKYEVCVDCGFLRAHEPHWLDEAYSSAIASADTGLVMRNIFIASKVAGALYWVMGERGDGKYLDTAGGHGMLTRLMRDMGFDCYWADKYCNNLLARHFEYRAEIGSCRAVTAIEVLEHLVEPVSFVEEALAAVDAEALLFTTQLYDGPPPPESWWYYSFETGQHIGFFQRRTLETLAGRLGLHFSSANGLHIFSKTPVNARLLGLATGHIASCIGALWIRWRLGSKTMTDHQLVLREQGMYFETK